MAQTIANVLTGVAKLSVRTPNDALAEWSTLQQYAGDRSVRLYKAGSGNAGSTHFQMTPPVAQTLTDFVTAVATYSFWYWYSAVTGNFVQFELRFEDPDSDAWVEATVVPHQNTPGGGGWLQKSLEAGDKVGFGGVDETGLSFFKWDLATTITTLINDIDNLTVVDSGPWTLARVRLELWEPEPERTAYVDSIELNGVVYAIEPGGNAPAMTLSSPYRDIGYTEDGVMMTLTTDTADIEVEEETFPIGRRIVKETAEFTVNMAESDMFNLALALPGSVLNGNILTMGEGVMKTVNIKLSGITIDGFSREIFMPRATATGAVALPFKKGEKTVVPLTIQALKPQDGAAFTVVTNAA